VIEAGFHETAIRMVVEGKVDGSAIDSQVLAVAMRDDPSLRDAIRVVDALGPSTIQPVAVSRRVPEALRNAVRDTLVAMGDDAGGRERLRVGLVERFVPVGPEAYDDIRMMVEACEAAGFTELR
jgi:phosphonate transport system substrate-binding protein